MNMKQKHYLGALAALIALSLAACGGGGSSPQQPFGPPAAPPPGSLALISSVQNVAVTSTNGANGVVAIPGGTGTVNVAVSSAQPAGTAALQSITRTAQSATATSASADSPLVYVMISAASATATLNGVPGFTLTLPAAPAASVFEAVWNGAQWITVGNAGTVSGTSVTLAGSTTAQTVTPGSPIFVVAYEGVSLAGVQSNVMVDGGFESEGPSAAFAGATSGWTPCSYAHVDAGSTAAAPTPIPAIVATKVTADLVSSSSPSFTVGATPKPGSTATPAPVIAPAVHSGSFAALTYTGTGAETSIAKSSTGANGICQTFVVPVAGVLSMFVNEGGDESTGFGDQEATLFVGGISALASAAPSPISVFNELNANVPAAGAASAAYVERGPYALTEAPPMGLGIAPNTTVTLYVGTFDDGPSNKFGEYMFVDDVSLMGFVPQGQISGTPVLTHARLPGQ
jgi:hypothetical protein